MAATVMSVEVVSAEAHVFSGQARELYARGVEGEIGILPGHQPALVALDIGAVKVVGEDGEVAVVAVHRGVLFVGEDGHVIVLADIAELAGDVDVERAEAKRHELQERLSGSDASSTVLTASLRKQQLRLEVARQATAQAQGR
jgi:F-type H+-transporting ATPase subunit epsilon